MQTEKLTRVFRFKKKGTTVTLTDPNPDFTVEEVIRFYSSSYPELTTSILTGPTIDGKDAVYELAETLGTKG